MWIMKAVSIADFFFVLLAIYWYCFISVKDQNSFRPNVIKNKIVNNLNSEKCLICNDDIKQQNNWNREIQW